MRLSFFVQGEPTPKQSFRAGGRNGGHADPRVKAWQDTVGWEARAALSSKGPAFDLDLSCDVVVELNFYLGNRRRVDLDNLSKGVLDGLKGILFADDSQVVVLNLRKFYKPSGPGVMITVKPAEAEKAEG